MYNQFNILETLHNLYNKPVSLFFFYPLEQYFAYFGISTIAIMGLQLHEEKKVDKHDILR